MRTRHGADFTSVCPNGDFSPYQFSTHRTTGRPLAKPPGPPDGHALRRFDARVLQLMARNVEVPLALSNLAARDQVTAGHMCTSRATWPCRATG